MDGLRGTEHLPHSLLKTLQQREAVLLLPPQFTKTLLSERAGNRDGRL